MTDKELIQTLRCRDSGDCFKCGLMVVCGNLNSQAADRLEALLAENERLKAGKDTDAPTKWVSVEERLPETMTVKFETRCGVHEYQKSRPVLGADEDGEIAIVCIICYKDSERWWENADESGDTFDIAYWMPIPELPSTEGVE